MFVVCVFRCIQWVLPEQRKSLLHSPYKEVSSVGRCNMPADGHCGWCPPFLQPRWRSGSCHSFSLSKLKWAYCLVNSSFDTQNRYKPNKLTVLFLLSTITSVLIKSKIVRCENIQALHKNIMLPAADARLCCSSAEMSRLAKTCTQVKVLILFINSYSSGSKSSEYNSTVHRFPKSYLLRIWLELFQPQIVHTFICDTIQNHHLLIG